MSDKKYNQTVRSVYGLMKTDGEIGIEIEVEGNNLLKNRQIGAYWKYVPDHSLRGPDNAEYVITTPIKRDTVRTALTELFGLLRQNKAVFRKDSPNTSVHVHLNVQEWSIKQVYSFICLWYIVEHTMMDWCGADRVGNLFCLRGSDAEYALQRLASAVRYSRYNDLNDQDGLRYLSLNYTAMPKFGSLEFRGLSGVYDPDVIDVWIKMLVRLKDFAEKFQTPPDIIAEYSRSGPEDFMNLALGDLAGHVMKGDYKNQLKFGMRLIQNVAYAVNWDREAVKKNLDPAPQPQEGFAEQGDIVDIVFQTQVRHQTQEENQAWAEELERQGLLQYVRYSPAAKRWLLREELRPRGNRDILEAALEALGEPVEAPPQAGEVRRVQMRPWPRPAAGPGEPLRWQDFNLGDVRGGGIRVNNGNN